MKVCQANHWSERKIKNDAISHSTITCKRQRIEIDRNCLASIPISSTWNKDIRYALLRRSSLLIYGRVLYSSLPSSFSYPLSTVRWWRSTPKHLETTCLYTLSVWKTLSVWHLRSYDLYPQYLGISPPLSKAPPRLLSAKVFAETNWVQYFGTSPRPRSLSKYCAQGGWAAYKL